MNWMKRLKHYLLLICTVFLFCGAHAETKEQRTKIALRTIGHEFLLQLSDSTSRVLPIEKINGRFALSFEKDFAFEPDFLFFATFKVLNEFSISDSYIVEVETCDSSNIIHSFEANLSKKDRQIACKLRELPLNCYVFYFTVVEGEQPQVSPENTVGNSWLAILIALVIAIGAIVYFKRKKSTKPVDHIITIGLFEFDQKGMTLKLNGQSIELSSKEADLLYLLNANENKTLEREHILNVVWGDDGDYVGRTLDVFISKLRKKLEADSRIKIINVRGVGYRLVIN